MTPALQRDSFRAMGTNCAVAVTADSCDLILARRALHAAQREVTACERVLSRFDAYSDLSRLNSASGAWVAVDARLIGALAAALRARTDTRGRFDPTILPALTAAGYDRSFELLTERPARPLKGWRAGARIDLDPDGRRARVERGAAVDLGGIGKGFTATRALDAMRTAWPALTGALVDLGGDIAVWGTPPEDGPWRVEIADPRAPDRALGTLELTDGGVATSGRDTRRFGPGGRFHHLIDPATGAPAVAGPLSVTVVAPTATEAEAYATALAIAEVGDARDQLASRPDIAALLVPFQGEPIAIGRVPMARAKPRARLVVTTQAGRLAWH
jgi:thiamine biosynthesis lipoprotein